MVHWSTWVTCRHSKKPSPVTAVKRQRHWPPKSLYRAVSLPPSTHETVRPASGFCPEDEDLLPGDTHRARARGVPPCPPALARPRAKVD